jgi:hypothetical protein
MNRLNWLPVTALKRGCLAAVLAAGVSLVLGGRASAQQFSVTITVDENGHGTLTNTTGFFGSLPAALLQDPGPGGLPGALTYDLTNPPGLTAGDLIILEPGTGLISDLIRFNPNQVGPGGGTGTLVFYSDISDTPDALADIGFPTGRYTNTLTVTEVGPEGDNGFTYTPTAGQPGFVAGASGPVTYVIQSDVPNPVPAPPAVVLAGLGAGVVGLRRYVGRRRVTA